MLVSLPTTIKPYLPSSNVYVVLCVVCMLYRGIYSKHMFHKNSTYNKNILTLCRQTNEYQSDGVTPLRFKCITLPSESFDITLRNEPNVGRPLLCIEGGMAHKTGITTEALRTKC